MAKAIPDLLRYPVRKGDPLQAWDSADELMLAHLAKLDLEGKRILIMNDGFGALSSALSNFEITTYTDSFVSAEGIRLNSEGTAVPIHELSQLRGYYDFVLMKVPKNLSFLEDELCRISHHLKSGAQLICGAMIKHLPKNTFDLIQKYFGDTSTSLAEKKARLIFAKFSNKPVPSPFPISVKIDNFAQPFLNHSNLFSREKLDIGTRFFLTHIPKGNFKTILDLGCANGIVGIAAKQMNPDAHIIFTDESAMAVESAKANFQQFFPEHEATFVWTNCYEKPEKETLDLVLCNPPFHQNNTVGDFIAYQMFVDSKLALKVGGRLRVIGNSHLPYPAQLQKIFGNCTKVAANSKFLILDAVKMP
jgi:23S rRNA (guanine1835-N2)-methyltransferase